MIRTGYRPSVQASALRTNQTYVLTLLYQHAGPSYIVSLQNGALEECNRHRYSLNIFPCDVNDEARKTQIDRFLAETKTDGIVVAPPLSTCTEVPEVLEKSGIPYALIGIDPPDSDVPGVFSDDIKGGYEMTQHLISLGHTRIGFIHGKVGRKAASDRFIGYCKALKESEITLDESLLRQGNFDIESGEKCARSLLSKDARPTAIFASNDYMAAGVYKVAQQMGIKIPNDLSIAGYDNSPVACHLWPGLTTMEQPVDTLAKYAFRKLIVNRIGNSDETIRSSFDSHLITRNSTAPRI